MPILYWSQQSLILAHIQDFNELNFVRIHTKCGHLYWVVQIFNMWAPLRSLWSPMGPCITHMDWIKGKKTLKRVFIRREEEGRESRRGGKRYVPFIHPSRYTPSLSISLALTLFRFLTCGPHCGAHESGVGPRITHMEWIKGKKNLKRVFIHPFQKDCKRKEEGKGRRGREKRREKICTGSLTPRTAITVVFLPSATVHSINQPPPQLPLPKKKKKTEVENPKEKRKKKTLFFNISANTIDILKYQLIQPLFHWHIFAIWTTTDIAVRYHRGPSQYQYV